MLQNIHDKAKGGCAYLIVGAIAIPFTLFGISSYLGGSNSLVAATVNGEEILVQEVQNAVIQQRQRLTQMFGGKLPPNFNDNTMKKQALEQIVSGELVRQESAKHGYRASNQEVFDTIANIGAFQKDGKFDSATYEKLLAAQRRSKTEFEAEIRDSISNQQLSQALNKAAFIPSSDLSRYEKLENQTRSIEFYTLKKNDFKSEVTISDDELKTYYDGHQKNYMTNEKVKVSYIEMKQSDLAKLVEVTDDELHAFYEENATRYTDPEQRKLAHILVKISDEGDAKEAEKKAMDRAQSLYDQITAGTKTFEELATSDSDDTFSAKKAGDMGFVARGDMGALFENLAFSLSKDEVSQPTKSEAGIEIVKLLEIKDSSQKSFDSVKSEVEKVVRSDKASKQFFDKSEKLQTLAFENEGGLDEAADAVGLKIKTSDWISKGENSGAKDLISSPKIMAAAFSNDVLNQGRNSELLEIDSDTVAVIRMLEHETPKQKDLADVTPSIKATLVDQKLRKLLIKKGEATLAALKEKPDWSAVTEFGGSVDKLEKNDAVKRRGSKLAPALGLKVFSMQKPVDGKLSFDSAILPNGDYVLIGLAAVKEGEADESAKEALKSRYDQMLGSREQSAMLKGLREEADVELFLDNIQ